MSSSVDGKIFVWDNAKAGEEQARHDYEDGPPELVFPHETHTSQIEDIQWSPHEPFFAVSAETDMLMQVWRMNQEFFDQEIDYLDKLDRIQDYDLE